jgi:hypothetical protein
MSHALPARRLLAAAAAALLAALGLITAIPARGAAATLYVAQADRTPATPEAARRRYRARRSAPR